MDELVARIEGAINKLTPLATEFRDLSDELYEIDEYDAGADNFYLVDIASAVNRLVSVSADLRDIQRQREIDNG